MAAALQTVSLSLSKAISLHNPGAVVFHMLDNSAHYTRLDTRRMMPALGKATMAIFTW